MKTAVLVMALLAFFIPAALSQNDSDGLLAEGKSALRRGDAEHAAELFEKAVAVRPNSADAHY